MRRQRREEGKRTLARLGKHRGRRGAPQGPERRALGARARGIPGGERSFRGQRGSLALLGCPPPPGSSGVPSWGPEIGVSPACGRSRPLAQAGLLGSQRSRRVPQEYGCRAKSWGSETVIPAGRIICRAPLGSAGSPSPKAPAGPLRSALATRTKGNKNLLPSPYILSERLSQLLGVGTLARGLVGGQPSSHPYLPVPVG
ncbi:hypothetical protein AAY473_013989 [Plecturocebus cupreus]